ncbi:AAT2 [Cyberlindnera jadinii]|uniref:Aspartate aminotransferase n=1 Tax=Cyberlindnera jadinii (strain ATCC 18201 / CBS 1600 / BCRC 20928 / JCM 3617 / NBRC 0987 / NRRL Y-1542) TaxID=983966 RepID=A0A0H5C937_CYBJN|nr:PLP-dependent transferase [Cyberlindnera jadinii NRRL Y-1542]ODV71260.1 PLP-dependent transferase [Cyberlindnera jadinii NRRL Y-1542]CEP24895.1 AAT2 [Cyberlindnera jadinii]
MPHLFSNIEQLPPDALFGLKARYVADDRATKVDLGIGAYRDENGKPWVLPSVKRAEKLLQEDPSYNHEYLPIQGFAPFVTAAAQVILGEDSPAIAEKRLVSVQSLSGTGALHVAAKFIKKFYSKSETVYLSKPTWANHFQVFETIGLKTATYAYWKDETKSLDLEGYLRDIESAPEGSVFLLHACAHNPTGLDPTPEEWTQILNAIKKKNHLPIFDSAYQGFASGSLEKDAWALREGVKILKETPIIVCQSFAKNVGMYGERVGAFHLVLPTDENKAAILSQLQVFTRSELSNPPAYGAKVVAKVLTTPELRKQWQDDLITMSQRIHKQRLALRDRLVKLQTPGNWDHIVNQQGMFSFTGLSKEQVARLESKHAVYMTANGRASVAGLNEHNVEYVANAIDEVVRSASKL